EAASGYLHKQDQDTERFRAPRFQTDRDTQPSRTRDLLESSSGQAVPFHRAHPSHCFLLKDMQLKSWNAAPMAVCNQHPAAATSHSNALAEPLPPLEWDPCAAGSDTQPEFHVPAPEVLPGDKCLEEKAKQISSVTFSSQKRLLSPLASVAPGSSFPRDGVGGIMPLEVDSAGTEEQSHDRQRWEGSKSCSPSPVLAGSLFNEVNCAEQGRSHPVSAHKDGVDQDTGSLSAQDSGKRQALSAKKSDFLTQGGSGLGWESVGVRGLDTGLSQELNVLIEPHSLSSSQQEKSSSGHIQLFEGLEGSHPAEQMDLLKDQSKLGEERKSPVDPPLIPKEVRTEHTDSSHLSPSGGVLSLTSGAPSSPSLTSGAPSSPPKKFLSCVHITLCSKVVDLEQHGDVHVENGMKSWDKPQVKTQSMSSKAPEALREAAPKFPPADLIPEGGRSPFPVFSSGISTAGQELGLQSPQALGSGGCIPRNISSPAEPGRRISGAATQVTTESPEKTTFSAEFCVHSQEGENAAQKPPEVPNVATSSHKEIFPFPRQPAQPLLLPYKPSGSTGMYYVPFPKGGIKMPPTEPETRSNDALPPRFPALRDAVPPGTAALQHKQGISSRKAKPKLAWAEDQRIPPRDSAEHRHHSKSLKSSHSTLKSTRFYLPHPMATSDTSEFSEESSGMGNAPPSCSAWKKHRHQRVFSAHPQKSGKKEFFPLSAEADESKNKDLIVGNKTSGMELRGRGREGGEAAGISTPHLGNVEKPTRGSSHSSGSLDELWVKFLERQRKEQHRDFGKNGELSLVERLDRLARVLQNPIKHTLLPTKDGPDKKIKGKEQTKPGLGDKTTPGISAKPSATRGKTIPVELRENRAGEKHQHLTETLEEPHSLDTPSDTSWESRPSGDPGTSSSCSPSERDTETPTERSSSVSSIDTARLLRAFGHHRVTVSPKLSQLYSTINQQKSRLEKRDEGSGGAAGMEYPEDPAERHRAGKEIQVFTSSWDSTCGSSISRGPSPALSTKRHTRMLNKGIQAGDLEIVSSATKKNTRDVGVTFPTPSPTQPSQSIQDSRAHGPFGKSDHPLAAGMWDKEKGHPSSFFMDKRMKRTKLQFPQAFPRISHTTPNTTMVVFFFPMLWNFSWILCLFPCIPRRVWPLDYLFCPQEALAFHRPDFISRSGERVRRLRHLMEQRRIHRGLQSQWEELGHPPGKRKGCRNVTHVLPDRGFPMREKRRAISRSEMVQRSKR
ncbi:ALMS1 protein, partial [Calyptomena viridis]|nr:ALMS1 protein [Calyptomena viridis]